MKKLLLITSIFSCTYLHAAEIGDVQKCFLAMGRDNFKVIAYSGDTKTLYYEIDRKQIVVLRPNAGFETTTRPNPVCKSIDGGDIGRLVGQIEKSVLFKLDENVTPDSLRPCAEASRFLGHEEMAYHLESAIKAKEALKAPAPQSPTQTR